MSIMSFGIHKKASGSHKRSTDVWIHFRSRGLFRKNKLNYGCGRDLLWTKRAFNTGIYFSDWCSRQLKAILEARNLFFTLTFTWLTWYCENYRGGSLWGEYGYKYFSFLSDDTVKRSTIKPNKDKGGEVGKHLAWLCPKQNLPTNTPKAELTGQEIVPHITHRKTTNWSIFTLLSVQMKQNKSHISFSLWLWDFPHFGRLLNNIKSINIYKYKWMTGSGLLYTKLEQKLLNSTVISVHLI